MFKSYHPDYADGGQLRDFIYVKDCVNIIAWLLENPKISGLFNVGTGRARSWLELAHALFAAISRPPLINYIEMPQPLKNKYQYFTEAKMNRLWAAGYSKPLTDLETGVGEYVREFLCRADPYR